MTKKQAFNRCEKLWRWCAKTGEHKNKWIGWIKNGGKYSALYHCFACEYAYKQANDSRGLCLLEKLWKGLCFGKQSPYYLWEQCYYKNDIKSAKKYAKIIADYCKKEGSKL